jgi:molybdopterin-guanine dinucleotide biosynthesis protein A
VTHLGGVHALDGTVRRVTATAGLLLTGGASSRLGVPKGELRRAGERLADRNARLLASVCTVALEVGPGSSPLAAVREDPPGSGPLAALVAGAEALHARGVLLPVLVLGVDLPFVDAALLGWLAARPGSGTVVPRVDGSPQPLCARYGRGDLDVAARLRGEGAASMRSLLDVVAVTYVDEGAWRTVAPASCFEDVDTPDAVARAGLEWPPAPLG